MSNIYPSLSNSILNSIMPRELLYGNLFSNLQDALKALLYGKLFNPNDLSSEEGTPEFDFPKESSEVEEKELEGINLENLNYGFNIAGLVANLAGSWMPEKAAYLGTYGNRTRVLDNAYDSIGNFVGLLGPYGKLAQTAMLVGAALGKGILAIGGGTDGMTKLDSILDSSFFNLTPFGMINGFGGENTESITANTLAQEQVGSSYGNTMKNINDALNISNKKIGLFSTGERYDMNNQIAEARKQQRDMTEVANTASDKYAIRNSMSAINDVKRRYHLQKGYNQGAVSYGKLGLITARKSLLRIKEDPFLYYLHTLPQNLQDSSDYRVRDYWEFNGRPKDFQEALSKGMFIKDKKGLYHAKSVQENPNTGEIEYMKSENHPTRYMESDWYEKGLVYDENGTATQLLPNTDDYNEWKDFVKNYELQKTSPYWKYVRRSLKKKLLGGTILKEVPVLSIIKEVSVGSFKEGGKFNIIPDGALHARKHNIDIEGITKKGIPVVSESKGGEIEQLAEIEKQELILRLDITKKLEDLLEEYNSATQKRKDELAIDAGKLLTTELIHNTKNNGN